MKIPFFPPRQLSWYRFRRKIPKFCSEIFAFALSRKKESIRFYVLSNPYRSVIAKRVIHLESPSFLFFKLKTKTFSKTRKTDLMICCCSVSQSVFLPFFEILHEQNSKVYRFEKDCEELKTIIWTHSELSSRLRAFEKRNQRSVKSIRSNWLQLTFRNNTLEASFNIYNSNFVYCWMRKTVKRCWTFKVSQELSLPLFVFKLSRHKN